MVILGMGIVAAALMVWLQVRHVRRVGRDRRAAVAGAYDVLSDVAVTQDGIGYPTVRGRYGGHDVKAELIVDTLTLRQLPRLWLAVTVKRPLAVGVPVDVVLRPLPTDIVSPGARFGFEHPRPAGWPDHLRIATPTPGPLPDLEAVDELGGLLHEQETKSVLMTPRGVRIVTELARGDVARYRVTRRPDFDVALEGWRLRRVLDDALAVADGIDRARRPVGAGV